MKITNNDPEESSLCRSISVHCVNSTISLSPPDITCMEGEGNYTYIYTYSGKKYLVPKTIKNLHTHLNNDDDFIRVHKSYLINTNHIVDYTDVDRTIKMAGGKEVYISRRKSKEINRKLSNVL
ncbi:LytTR family DNA-binding domain-containing protein [Ravibacter arvi]